MLGYLGYRKLLSNGTDNSYVALVMTFFFWAKIENEIGTSNEHDDIWPKHSFTRVS